MCCFSSEIATVVWKESPTLRALVKMVTSVRYRFPTVDCDDTDRDEMKKAEQVARDEVGSGIICFVGGIMLFSF